MFLVSLDEQPVTTAATSTTSSDQLPVCRKSHSEIPLNAGSQFFSFKILSAFGYGPRQARGALCGSNSDVSLNSAERFDVTAPDKFALVQFSFEFGGSSEVSVEICRGSNVSMTYKVCLHLGPTHRSMLCTLRL